MRIKSNIGKVKEVSCRVVLIFLLFLLFGGNICFAVNASNKVQKVNKSNSVVTKSKIKKKGSTKKKNNEDSDEDIEERISKLEKRVQELEERLSKLEDKLFNSSDKKEKSKKKDIENTESKDKEDDWMWPAPGYHHITSGFSDKEGRSHVHGAIDIGGDAQHGSIYGASIVAANSGTVTVACTNGYGGGYGNYVVIDHGDNKSTLYGHLSSVSVSKDQKVSKGEEIGKAGSTGFATGPHLHFEYRVNGVRTNPRNILNY